MHKTLLIITLLITQRLCSMNSMNQLSKIGKHMTQERANHIFEVPSLLELCSKKTRIAVEEYITQELSVNLIDWHNSQTKEKIQEFLANVPGNLIARIIWHAKKLDISKEPLFEASLSGLCDLDMNHTHFVTTRIQDGLVSVLDENINMTTSISIKGYSDCVYDAVLSPNNDYIAINRFKSIAVYAIKQPSEPIATIEGFNSKMLFFHDTLLVAGYSNIEMWKFLENTSCVQFVDCKGIGKKLCLSQGSLVFSNLDAVQNTINVVGKNAGVIKKKLYGHAKLINHLSSHAATHKIASASSDCTARIWDIEKDSESACIAILLHEFGVCTVAFDSSGNNIITGTDENDHAVYLWDISSQKLIARYEFDNNWPIMFLSWSTTNNSIIAKNGAGEVFRWKPQLTELGKILATIVEEQKNSRNNEE